MLADEMGLGKTMQAITAIRLLLRRGEMRSVLLVCPKPLVTNWQREFALWAPELPLTVIEGDQARRAWQWQLADVPLQDRQLRTVAARPRVARLEQRPALRPGGARRSRSGSRTAPARTSEVGPRDLAAAQLGPDRHAGRKQRRRPGGDLRVPRPGLSFAEDEAAADGPGGQRLRPAAHQGPGAHRPAAQDVPRRRAGTDARAARDLSAGRGRRRGAADRAGRRGHDPARLRAGAAAEADLQLRSGHRRQLEARTAGSRPGRSRRQRPQGDRLQPMGRHARAAGRAARAVRPAGVSRAGAQRPAATT